MINRKLLRAFARHHIPATGFVIEHRAEQIGIRTGMKEQHANDTYETRTCYWYDTSDVFIARTGVRRANDLVGLAELPTMLRN